MSTRVVQVRGLPAWLDARRLLGAGPWRITGSVGDRLIMAAELPLEAAADLDARLRGVGLGGSAIDVHVEPMLSRASVRRARLHEARRYRQGSPGFLRPGVRLDPDGRRSVTPEAIALELGRRAQRMSVVDACCGLGGNAIGFARAGCEVTAIELDPTRLERARHNARVYGVEHRIHFVLGDARALLRDQSAKLLFIDPPWGERYDKHRVALEDLPLLSEVLPLTTRFAHTWIKAPPSFDIATIAGARVTAFFGVGKGDERRVKFLLLEC